jgi:hypothetical protein
VSSWRFKRNYSAAETERIFQNRYILKSLSGNQSRWWKAGMRLKKKKAWAALVGGYIFSHNRRFTAQAIETT